MIRWHKSDLENRMYCVLEDGIKIAMPRYYKDKLYTEVERSIIAFFIKQNSELREAELEKQMIEKYGDDHIRVKMEAHKASFRKMYKDSARGRDKI